MIPSPVVLWSKNIICPDCSPPRAQPFLSISSSTYRSPTFVLIIFIPSLAAIISNPMFVITVTTMVFPFSLPSFFICKPVIAKILSPSIRSPFSSQTKSLSASPSKARPISAFISRVNLLTLFIYVEPHLSFIFIPFGLSSYTKTWAPSLLSISGAILYAAPFAQSNAIFSPFKSVSIVLFT